jgi:hypothetical protein
MLSPGGGPPGAFVCQFFQEDDPGNGLTCFGATAVFSQEEGTGA